MKRFLSSFIAEDSNGNVYRIERFQEDIEVDGKPASGNECLLHKGAPVTHIKGDLYYIAELDIEVMKIR